MRKLIIGTGALLLATGGVLLSIAPDTLSMLVLGVMCAVLVLGFFAGLMPALSYGSGFKTARQSIEHTLDIQSTETWIAVFKIDTLFRQRTLDKLFRDYKNIVEQQKEDGEIVNDVEEYIS